MRVTVFGASGKIGRLVVDRLLDDGSDVVAYVRDPAGIPWTHPQLTVVVGELSDTTSIGQAVTGSAAVISTLGPARKRGTSGTAITDGTRAIVAAMDRRGSPALHRSRHAERPRPP